MHLKKVVLAAAIALVLGISIGLITYHVYSIEGKRIYSMSVTVGDHVGFDVDNESLAFGMIMPGSTSSTRFIILNNDRHYPVYAEFTAEGNFADWISIQNERIKLEPHENREIPVSASAPPDAEHGNYTGELTIIFRKA